MTVTRSLTQTICTPAIANTIAVQTRVRNTIANQRRKRPSAASERNPIHHNNGNASNSQR